MEHQKIFVILRKILGTLGLSPEAVDDIIERIYILLLNLLTAESGSNQGGLF